METPLPRTYNPPLTEDEADIEVAELEALDDQDDPMPQPRLRAPQIPGALSSEYKVSEQDALAWVPAWKLQTDWKGREYGRPIRLPRGQLDGPSGLLRARRADGGRAFTLRRPPFVEPEPQIRCVVVPGCSYRGYTKMELIAHCESCHPAESRPYARVFEEFRVASAEADEKLKFLLQQSDRPLEAMPSDPETARRIIAEAQGEEELPIFRCETPGCKRFFDSDAARQMHYTQERKQHKAEVGGQSAAS